MTLVAVRALLQDARRVAVLTGAGMSAESGVPTFRDALTGLWSSFDPEQLATPQAFRANPALVWRWYSERRAGVLAAQPHAGHVALALATARFDSLTIVTQNVDGLHARAGSSNVLELHGNILHSRCLDECGVRYDHPDHLPAGAPPRCPGCGAPLRPSVVWFGEGLDPAVMKSCRTPGAAGAGGAGGRYLRSGVSGRRLAVDRPSFGREGGGHQPWIERAGSSRAHRPAADGRPVAASTPRPRAERRWLGRTALRTRCRRGTARNDESSSEREDDASDWLQPTLLRDAFSL
jgi:NAD-dependent deacetylase